MKFSSLLLTAACLLLLIACDDKDTPGPSATTKSSDHGPKKSPETIASGGLKIAYVNTDSILARYDLVRELEEEIIQEQISLEDRYKQQVQQLEKELAYAQQEAATLSQEKLQMLQMEFAQKEQALMLSKQQMEQQLVESERKKNEQLFNRVQSFVTDYSKDEGYDMILGQSSLVTSLLYAHDRYDLTQVVIDSLNTLYAAENETALTE